MFLKSGPARVPVLALAAIALAGCASTTANGGSTPSSTPTGSSTSTASQPTHPSTVIHACRAADLRFTVGHGGAAAGTFYWNLVATNVGTKSCTLKGYPGAVYVNRAGKPVGSVADHDVSYPPATVTLARGGVASSLIGATDVFNFSGTDCRPVAVPGVVVSIPGDPRSTFVSEPGEACANAGVSTLHVRAFVAGAGQQG